jgi:LysM repeat protein
MADKVALLEKVVDDGVAEGEVVARRPSPHEELQQRGIEVVAHALTPHDSLHALALRYGATVANIQRANNLLTTDLDLLPPHTTLFIPVTLAPSRIAAPAAAAATDSDEQRAKQRAVRVMADAVPQLRAEECRFYLEEHGYNMVEAVQAAKDDMEWERKNPHNKKRK